MGIYSYLKSLVGAKSITGNDYPGTWTNLTGGIGDMGVNERNALLNNTEWVYIAVDKVASAVASVRFKVMRYTKNGDDQEVFDGPLVDFLERPGTGFTGKDFIYLNTAYKELTGNAFWERTGGRKLDPMVPTFVTPILSGSTITGFRYTFGGKERVLPVKNVLHDRYIDPARPYWGAGKLTKVARWVDTSTFANEFLRRFFLNGATFGGFIETDEENEERIKLIKLGLLNDHTGVENAHKIGVLPKNSKYTQTTKDMSQIEMGATDDRYRDKILAAFGVPKTLVGLTTEVNRASAEAAEYVFSRYTVKPVVDDLVEFLNVNIAAAFDPDGKYYFDYEEFIPGNMDIELREREISLARQAYKTINEVRAEVGLPPVKGGDVIYGAPFQTPLGSPQAAPEPLPVGDEDDDLPPPEKARQRAIPGRVRQAGERTAKIDDLVEKIASKLAELPEDREAKDAADHREFASRADAYRDQLEKAVRDFNNRQQRQLLIDLASVTKAVAKNDLWDMTAEISILMDFVSPILGGLLTEQALEEYAAQGFPGAFDPNASSVSTIVERAAKRMAKSYNNTTANLIKQALNDGITSGENLNELTKRIQEVYEFSDVVRAKAVAHTESFYIANEGSREAYQQSGVVKSVRWYTAEDERVCPHCLPMNGRSIPVNDVFFKKGETMVGADGSSLAFDYRTIDVPPLHTNCRCFIRPDVIDIGE